MAKVLIIDDEKPVRDALEAVVIAAGHEARLAVDGRKGVEQFISFQPDLVITDILMPEKEGIETITDLRRLRPDVPIVAMSGGGRVGNTSFLKMAERLGANRTLAKPFSPSVLMTVLAELLRKSA